LALGPFFLLTPCLHYSFPTHSLLASYSGADSFPGRPCSIFVRLGHFIVSPPVIFGFCVGPLLFFFNGHPYSPRPFVFCDVRVASLGCAVHQPCCEFKSLQLAHTEKPTFPVSFFVEISFFPLMGYFNVKQIFSNTRRRFSSSFPPHDVLNVRPLAVEFWSSPRQLATRPFCVVFGLRMQVSCTWLVLFLPRLTDAGRRESFCPPLPSFFRERIFEVVLAVFWLFL